jgi:catechol-2,3-dioxygenase
MDKPKIRHIAIKVRDQKKVCEYFKTVFGLDDTSRGPNGTIPFQQTPVPGPTNG